MRPCSLCEQVDDGPRDNVVVFDTGQHDVHHFECGAAAGCESCKTTLAEAAGSGEHRPDVQ